MASKDDALTCNSDGSDSDGACQTSRCGLAEWLAVLRQEFGARLLFLLFAIQHLIKGLGATIGGQANPYLCKEYHVSAQDMQILKTLIFSPYILKPMLGLTSDLFPINGYNKAPYLLLATGAGVAAAFVVGLAEMPLRMFVLCLFLVELMICTDDLLTEAIYSRQMQDKPAHGQDLLTFVFAGMSFWSLLASLASGFLLTFLGPHAVYLLVAACALPALTAACTTEEPRKSASAVRTARAKIWRQKELFILALVMSGASVSLSSVAALTTRPVVNASVALLAALVVLGAFLLLLSPVIAKFAAFTLIQTSLHLSVSGPAFYFLTDSPEQYPQGPHFSKVFYNTCLGSVGSLATLLGLYTYNRYSAYFSYRTLLVVSNITFSVLHLADSLLFSRLNLALGIPDMAFAFGNQSLGPVVYQWLWMPQVGLFSQLCPKGIEATMFALIVACHNLGVAVASSCGALLLQRLGCNPRGESTESQEFDSLWLASAIASLLPLISVVALLALIPDVKPGERVSNIEQGDGTAGSLWKQWMGSEHTMLLESDSS